MKAAHSEECWALRWIKPAGFKGSSAEEHIDADVNLLPCDAQRGSDIFALHFLSNSDLKGYFFPSAVWSTLIHQKKNPLFSSSLPPTQTFGYILAHMFPWHKVHFSK